MLLVRRQAPGQQLLPAAASMRRQASHRGQLLQLRCLQRSHPPWGPGSEAARRQRSDQDQLQQLVLAQVLEVLLPQLCRLPQL